MPQFRSGGTVDRGTECHAKLLVAYHFTEPWRDAFAVDHHLFLELPPGGQLEGCHLLGVISTVHQNVI